MLSTLRSEITTELVASDVADMTVAPAIREKVASSGERFWRPSDFDGSPGAVAKALSRLADAGELRRVRRGLYWRGTPTRLGMAPPSPARIAEEVAGSPGIGPAGLSAALALGLATQVPRSDMIAVPARVPRNPGAVRLVSRAASTRRRSERLRPAEVALLEVLRDWPGLVELPAADAADRVASLLDDGSIRVGKLVRASATEPPRVRERLRHLLAAVSQPSAANAVPPARSRSIRRDLAIAG
jgi:hypothetical protein